MPARRGWVAAALALPAALLASVGLGGLAAVAVPIVVGAAVGLLGEVPLFLLITTAVSGVGFYWAEGGVTLGGQTINLSGLHWGLILLTLLALLLRPGRSRVGLAPGPLRLYALYLGVAAVALLWAPSFFEGFKQLLLFALPALAAAVVLRHVTREGEVRLILAGFWLALGVAVAVAAGMSLFRWAEGEAGGLVGGVGARTLAIFLLPLMALALASARYRTRGHLWTVALVLVVGLATLSRTAMLVLLILPLLATLGMPRGTRIAVLGLTVLLGLGALQVEAFRERFGSGTVRVSGPRIEGSGQNAAVSLGTLNLSGRGWLWLHTGRHAVERPVLGHGTGSATVYLSQLPGAWEVHPHNDYLRVFHDQGAVGLLAMLAFGAGAAFHFRRLHREATSPIAKQLALAAYLATGAYGMIAVTDNPMLYATFFTQNVFLLQALAILAHRGWQDGAPEELEPAAERVAARS